MNNTDVLTMQSKQFKKTALLACFPFVLAACDSELSTETSSDPIISDPDSGVVLVDQPDPVAPYPTTVGYGDASAASSEFLLGREDYLAMSYGAYRTTERSDANAPTVDEIKEDLLIMEAMGIKVIRTYNTQDYPDTERLLEAIDALMNPDSAEYREGFEMFVMLGIWVDAVNSWNGGEIDRSQGSETSDAEMAAAIRLVNLYPEIIKVMAVGNEAMVHWANYHVVPGVILDYVNQLQGLKTDDFTKGYDDLVDEIPSDVWITSSDNFAAWSGEGDYANEDLDALVQAVDFVSVHSYPFHDTYYNPEFWSVPLDEQDLSDQEQIALAMDRAKENAVNELKIVQDYLISQDALKQIHIGETGWSTVSSDYFGSDGTKAADEYKQKLYYDAMREWSNEYGASLFFFEMFDEPWKGGDDTEHSEKHFGLIDIDGQAKYLLWDMVDEGVFDGLTRDGFQITKTYQGSEEALMEDVGVPEYESAPVDEESYVVLGDTIIENAFLNWWGGNSSLTLNEEGTAFQLTGGTAEFNGWWGLGVQISPVANLAGFESGSLDFDIQSSVDLTDVTFKLGMQTAGGDHYVQVGAGTDYPILTTSQSYSIPLAELSNNEAMDLTSVGTLMYFLGVINEGESYLPDGVVVEVSNVSYTK